MGPINYHKIINMPTTQSYLQSLRKFLFYLCEIQKKMTATETV